VGKFTTDTVVKGPFPFVDVVKAEENDTSPDPVAAAAVRFTLRQMLSP
jgi:hypothetical protein